MADLELSTTGLECPGCEKNTLLAVTTQFVNQYDNIVIFVIYHCPNCGYQKKVDLKH